MDGRYLGYTEYVALGGKLPESAFSGYITDAEAKLDYLTFNRLSKYDYVPEMVKKALVKFISILKDNSRLEYNIGISSYSNGIESISYDTSNGEANISIDKKLYAILLEYLIGYPDLLDRGIRR